MAGETSTRTGVNRRQTPATGNPNVDAVVWSHEYTTAQLELNDVLEMGYIPAGTLIGFFGFWDDLDTNATPTLAQKITVGSTDVKTGITTGQTGGGAFIGIEPVTVTAPTLVKVTNTAASATAAAGTFVLVPLYLGK